MVARLVVWLVEILVSCFGWLVVVGWQLACPRLIVWSVEILVSWLVGLSWLVGNWSLGLLIVGLTGVSACDYVVVNLIVPFPWPRHVSL